MKIINHLLHNDDGKQITYKASPNISDGFTPKYLVLHYTANDSFSGAIRTLTTPANKVSAHFVLGKTGELCQLVAMDKKAWHAGTSEYRGLNGLNAHSVGIEICNFGPLTLKNKKYYSWTNKEVHQDNVFTDEKGKHWDVYPHDQLEVLYDMSKAIVDHYKLIDVIRHSDICLPRGRKQDTGAALDIKHIRKHLFGREEAL